MYYEIYIDSLFFLNFIFDLMLLFLMKKILKCTATHLSLVIGAAFGAAMVCVLIIFPYIGLLPKLVLMYCFISMGMIKIAFRNISVKGILKAQLLLYVLSFVFGGMVQWIAINIPFVRKNGLKMTEVTGMGCIAFVLCSFVYQQWKRKKTGFVRVTLYRDDKEITVMALVDTGNGLTEPISGKPVSVIEKRYIEDAEAMKENASYCVIPYHSVGRAHGIMEGFRIPKMVIEAEERKITVENTVLGICEGNISSTGNYQMILNPKLLED